MNWRSRLWNPEAAYQRGVREGRNLAEMTDWVNLVTRGAQMSWPEASREEVRAEAVKVHRQRVEAVPDLSIYPELEGCREAIEAGDRGLMEGGKFSPEEMAICREYIWIGRKHSDRSGVSPDKGCTGIFIAESPAGPLAANNLDDWLDNVPVPGPRAPISTPLGLGQIAVSSSVFCDDSTPEIFPAPVDYMVRELCATVDEALEFLTRYNYFWGPHNRLLFDKTGASAVIEKSSCRMGIRYGDGFSYTTAMHMETPEMKGFLRGRRDEYLKSSGKGFGSPDQAYWLAAEARHHNLARLTEAAAQNPSLESIRGVVQSRDGAASLCLHGDKCHPDEERVNYTISTTVWNVAQQRALCWRMHSQDGPLSCQSEAEEFCFSHEGVAAEAVA